MRIIFNKISDMILKDKIRDWVNEVKFRDDWGDEVVDAKDLLRFIESIDQELVDERSETLKPNRLKYDDDEELIVW